MGYLITILVIAIFIVILMVWAKKENEILDNLLSNLTEEQKRNLEDNQVEDFDEKKHTLTQRGMIAEVNVKGKNKVALKVLWYISYPWRAIALSVILKAISFFWTPFCICC